MAEIKTTQDFTLAHSYFRDELREVVHLPETLPGNLPCLSLLSDQTSILVPSSQFDLSGDRVSTLREMQLVAFEYGCLLSEAGSGHLSSIKIVADGAIPDPEKRNQLLAHAIKSLVSRFGIEQAAPQPPIHDQSHSIPYLRPLDFMQFLRPDSGLALSSLTVTNDSTAYERNYDLRGIAGVRISTEIRPGDSRIEELIKDAQERGYSLRLVDNREHAREIWSRHMGTPGVQEREARHMLEAFDRIFDSNDLYHFHLETWFNQETRNSQLWDFVSYVNSQFPKLRG